MTGTAETTASHQMSRVDRPRAAVLMAPPELASHIFGAHMARLTEVLEVGGPASSLVETLLGETEVLVTGWGAPRLDAGDLDRLPELRAIFHAGGSVRAVADPDELARRGVVASNAGESNAVPVAEYTVAMILLAGRDAWRAESLYRKRRTPIDREQEFLTAGGYGRTVGIVGASRTGRKVVEMLRATDRSMLLHDPYLRPAEAERLGVALVSLAELAECSDVVSIHAPETPETFGMIGAEIIGRLRSGATLINTARGSLIDHAALHERLLRGDLTAILDVTVPEPLPPDHPFWDLPNLVLTPHIAGAMGTDLRRLGDQLVSEIDRYRRGTPLLYREV